MLEVIIIPARTDNYAYLVHNHTTNQTALIDAPQVAPIQAVLKDKGWKLSTILITHKHADHIEGVHELCHEQCQIIAPQECAPLLPKIDVIAKDQMHLTICSSPMQIIHTPGHTLGHVVYYFEQQNWLFSGDTLFAFGCGRLFEGTPEMMFSSLQAIKALPSQTLVFCGHEYTLTNLHFAARIDPKNKDLQKLIEWAKSQTSQDQPTIPTTLEQEAAFNPFLNLSQTDALQTFARLREQRNHFTL